MNEYIFKPKFKRGDLVKIKASGKTAEVCHYLLNNIEYPDENSKYEILLVCLHHLDDKYKYSVFFQKENKLELIN